ncbi:amidohydrolase family protein [Rhizorhapis suberifaciens]|uniref:Putative TIM-barrel fold metal-dependent hydrolase n=1 Tax=Rhizorhapis suberifaciens TaxID=13656 RepID=A0A840HVD3_9SPHN|nr:amidohydrolase family protein [Rhizorhapis suberifaciens]MBB4641436.1 putative TIM-barrel fold metal-dependent hydrolase [Rhizorhapis suberifaciens]
MQTRKQWRDQMIENALDPDLPIIDSHHHLWMSSPAEPWEPYTPQDMAKDIETCGHNVVATIYTDSHANYRTSGPDVLKVVGETEFADSVARQAQAGHELPTGMCAAIVAHADLTLGAEAGEVLDAHIAASSRFRGIRHMTAFDVDLPPVYGATEPGIMASPAFRAGFAELAKRGLTFDAWAFQPQLPELVDLSNTFPDANIVVNHLGGPLAIGRFVGRRDEAFAQWKRDMALLARNTNVSLKLGGINMSQTGMDATDALRPHSSAETARLQRDHILTAIDLFGPSRCMFESNFPVDMRSISYTLIWNAFKRITADLSSEDRTALFAGTAARVYRMGSVEGVGA